MSVYLTRITMKGKLGLYGCGRDSTMAPGSANTYGRIKIPAGPPRKRISTLG